MDKDKLNKALKELSSLTLTPRPFENLTQWQERVAESVPGNDTSVLPGERENFQEWQERIAARDDAPALTDAVGSSADVKTHSSQSSRLRLTEDTFRLTTTGRGQSDLQKVVSDAKLSVQRATASLDQLDSAVVRGQANRVQLTDETVRHLVRAYAALDQLKKLLGGSDA
jgi:hypothetical protein